MPKPAAILLAALLCAGLAGPAAAHRLKVFATVVGGSVEGRAYFVGGGAAGNVAAVLEDSAGTVVAEGRTGGDGRFALDAPSREDLVVVVDALDGHVARFAIPADRLPDTLPSAPMAAAAAVPPAPDAAPVATPALDAAVEAAVARQIAPLAEQIDALEASVRLRDVIGGLGYIAGIFGLLAFLKARRARP